MGHAHARAAGAAAQEYRSLSSLWWGSIALEAHRTPVGPIPDTSYHNLSQTKNAHSEATRCKPG